MEVVSPVLVVNIRDVTAMEAVLTDIKRENIRGAEENAARGTRIAMAEFMGALKLRAVKLEDWQDGKRLVIPSIVLSEGDEKELGKIRLGW